MSRERETTIGGAVPAWVGNQLPERVGSFPLKGVVYGLAALFFSCGTGGIGGAAVIRSLEPIYADTLEHLRTQAIDDLAACVVQLERVSDLAARCDRGRP